MMILVPNQPGFKIANLNMNNVLKHINELRIDIEEIDILKINET